MQLTDECFSECFLGLVCGRFGKNLTLQESSVYFRKFSIYSDKTFAELCDRAFDLDFFPSVDWFKREYSELSERSNQEPLLSLPSAQMREVDNMTAEECQAAFLRLKTLMANCGRMPGISKEKAQPDRNSEIPEDFRNWLLSQPVVVNSAEGDRLSLIRIMSVSPRLRSEFMEFKQDEEDYQEW